MLSCLSLVWLCVTPWIVARQAAQSTGFPRQEYWSGFPFPSPVKDQATTLITLIFDKEKTLKKISQNWGICLFGSDGKESACNAGDWGLIPGSGRSREKGMPTHSSILAWRIPCTEQPGGLQSMGPQKVGYYWATNIFTFLLTLQKENLTLP